MDLKSFSQANQQRNEECFPQCEDWTPSDWLECLVGELGEYANIRKKVRRGDFTLDQVKEHLKLEIGDCLTYLDLLACSLGLELEDCVIAAFNKVSIRKNYPVKLGGEFGTVKELKAVEVDNNTFSKKNVAECIKLQNKEYDALKRLADVYHNGICKVSVVDDDFPEVKHRYESAVKDFIQALRDNGRI